MLELLEMCGFDETELETELPRIKKAFTRLGINENDILNGKNRLAKYFNIELSGLRKIIRLCVLELVNCILAREYGKEKIIFGLMATGWESIGSAINSSSTKILAAHQNFAYLVVMGCIFDRIIPALEAAESKLLKSGRVAYCGNVKIFAGLLETDILPKPDLMVTAGYACEIAPKTIDLLHEKYNIPYICSDTCQDREYLTYNEDTSRIVNIYQFLAG